ncbi:MAG: T9SS type A sorting domain-containing protein [Paludibacter sp.]|nr:T9SS type A sorting domain-containing protein [Paludibacter sp.]
MNQKIYIILFAIFALIWNSNAQEELLGQYHFNDAENYSEVGVSDAIVMNATEAIAQWTFSINPEGSGVYRAVNTSNRNYNQFPMAVSIQPKPGFIIKITKIEISHKTVTTGAGPTQKFSYYVGTAQTVASSIDISEIYNVAVSAESFTTLTLTPANPIEINENKMWFYNRIHLNNSNQFTTTEVDFIKFYGTYLDPNAPFINVPTTEQNIKGAPIGANASRVFNVTHKNLSDIITTSSSKTNFTAVFDDAEDGTYQKLRVTFQPTAEGYESAVITLASESTTATLKVRGWGLPENTLAAWSFEDQTIIPDYFKNQVDTPTIALIGGSGAAFFFKDSWMYEINNLYTKIDGIEIPEIAGIKFNNLGYNGRVKFKFDIQARNGSPNTMKVGSYNELTSEWLSGKYWRNPRIALGIELGVMIEFELSDGAYSVVSAFDQTVDPKTFVKINPTTVDFGNTTGWAFDNIIITSEAPQGLKHNDNGNSKIVLYPHQGNLVIKNAETKSKIEIISLHGCILKSYSITSDTQIPVDLKGIYLVRITAGHHVTTRKVAFQ